MKHHFQGSPHRKTSEIAPRKQLGQHFLRDSSAINRIVSAINALAPDPLTRRAHEIGPGEGVLTKPLLEAGWHLTSIEKDQRAVELLRKTVKAEFPETFSLIQSDILRWTPESSSIGIKPVCIGNIPYYITSDILLWLCEHKEHYRAAVLMVQKEVADRLSANHRSKEYGRLSVRIQLMFTVRTLFEVPNSSFFPPPKVDSAIVELVPTDFTFASVAQEKQFDLFTATLFSARRKMLRRGLARLLDTLLPDPATQTEFWKLAVCLDVQPETRPDAIPPKTILALHQFLWENRLHNS